MAPAAEVLASPELLEQIILQLPPRTILTKAQRVSKHWQYLVTTSPQIRHKLGMRSALTILASPVRPLYNLIPTYAKKLSVEFRSDDSVSQSTPWKGRDSILHVELLSTRYDFRRYHDVSRVRVISGCKKIDTSAMTLCPRPYADTTNGNIDSGEKSYRAILITRPACTVALVKVDFYSDKDSPRPVYKEIRATIRDAKGITFGMVEDVMMAMLKYAPCDEGSVMQEGFEMIHVCDEK